MQRSHLTRLRDLREGMRQTFWAEPAGQAVLALLDDLSLHALIDHLHDRAPVIIEGKDRDRIDLHATRPPPADVELRPYLKFISLPMVIAVHRALATRIEEVSEAHERRTAVISAALQLLEQFDNTPDVASPRFYEHPYAELRTHLAATLRELTGTDLNT